MYLEGTIGLLVYRDASQTEFPDKKVLDITEIFSNTAVGNVQDLSITLAASNNQTINFNSVGTTGYVFILSDTTDITVNMNATGNITFKAGRPSLLGASIGSMTIGNASSSSATNVSIYLITG